MPSGPQEGQAPASEYQSFVALLFPFSHLDVEYALLTYWWLVLLLIVVIGGIVEYVRWNWQVWCDRRRLRCFHEQCQARKALNDLLGRRGQSARGARPVGGAVGVMRSPTAATSEAFRRRSVGDTPSTGEGQNAPPLPLPTFLSIPEAEEGAGPLPRSLSSRARQPSRQLSDGPDLASRTSTPQHHHRVISSSTSGSSHTAAPTPGLGLKSTSLRATLSPKSFSSDDGDVSYGDGSSGVSSFSSTFPMSTYNCPKNLADEQVRMERRRQENEMDLMEARRALENTNSMVKRREFLTPQPEPVLKQTSPIPFTATHRRAA